MTILPCTYLGNIFYFANLLSEECIIEQYSNYIKQTYNNRCSILTSNGIFDLTIPVEKPKEKTYLKDIRISSHNDWQQLHWRAIESAYNSSPYFEYLADDFECFYTKKYCFLIDFNMQIQDKVLNILNLKRLNFCLSDNYIDTEKIFVNDYREIINPKKFNVSLYKSLTLPYYQVFSDKFGFTPNLSIIDLIFNMGNESKIYLKQIINNKLTF